MQFNDFIDVFLVILVESVSLYFVVSRYFGKAAGDRDPMVRP